MRGGRHPEWRRLCRPSTYGELVAEHRGLKLQRCTIAKAAGQESQEGTKTTLRNALAGVTRAFLLTNSSECAEAQQMAFVDAARQSGVAHVVKLSQLGAGSPANVSYLLLTR